MRRVTLLATTTALAACAFPEDPDDRFERWQEEADEHGAMGAPGTFALTGTPTWTGPLPDAHVDAPFTLEGPPVVFYETEVDGLGTGTVRIEGSIDVAQGRLAAGPPTSMHVGAGGVSLFLDPTSGHPATDLVVDDAVRFTFYPAEPNVAATEHTQALAFPDVMVASAGVTVASLDVAAEQAAVGGDVVGDASVGADDFDDVVGVFARDVETTFAASRADGAGRVTQVLTTDAVAIPSDVEIAPWFDDGDVEIERGQHRSFTFQFREKGYVGDGVVTSYRVEGAAADRVAIAASPPRDGVDVLFDAIEDSGPASPIVAIAVAPALPVVAIADALGDFFGGSGPPQPTPLPSWIDAGAVGTFSVVVQAADAIGPESVTIVVEGANFARFEYELAWDVVEPDDD